MKGRVELATEKQARGLLANYDPILDKVRKNRKLLVAPRVRHYREPCCVTETHCVNMMEGGYRRGMIEDLGRIRDAMGDQCRERGMRSYRQRWAKGPIDRSSDTDSIFRLYRTIQSVDVKFRFLNQTIVSVRFEFRFFNRPILFLGLKFRFLYRPTVSVRFEFRFFNRPILFLGLKFRFLYRPIVSVRFEFRFFNRPILFLG